ncbi:MAG: hypothetical protein U0837_02180 [Dehalococcoidia bacterium]|jgi:hypothetical protein
MRSKRFFAAVAAGLGILALIPVASALGDGPGESGRNVESATALGTGFTYQGRLTDAGSPANGTYDLRFILYDAETAGSAVGSTVSKEDVSVSNGLFSVDLDFGAAAFNGDARWLEIAVRPGSSTGSHTVLSPRQPISPAPYALFAKAAAGIAVPFAASGTSAGAPSSTTGLFTVTQTGTGIGIAGNRTSTDPSEYPAVLGTNAGGGAGVQGESTFASGVGVQGFAIGASGVGGSFTGPTAIELDGAIKVTGSSPAAFVLTVDNVGPDRNTCPGDGGSHLPDAAAYLPVSDPNAIVFITAVNVIKPVALTWYPAVAPAWCPGITNRWVIFTLDGTALSPGNEFNVLVIKQ